MKFVFPLQPINCQETGPANLAEQTFRGDIYASIVREAVQNSLDASQMNGKPVKVTFAYKCLDLSRAENTIFSSLLDSAEEHINLCIKKYKDREQQKRSFVDMLNAIKRFRRLNRLPYFEIADYETIGMYYDINNPENGRMCTFMHEDGEHFGNGNNGGGANGIGKTAYFSMSPLRMVLASTHAIPNVGAQPNEGKSFFSGSIKLVTHPNPDDAHTKFQYAGYYPEIPNNIPFLPLLDTDSLPHRLNRRPQNGQEPKLGTSFFIIGCEPKGIKFDVKTEDYDSNFEDCAQKAYKKPMLPSILRNYFAAIKYNKLEIELGHRGIVGNQHLDPIIINSENINNRMKETFQDNPSVKAPKVKENLNPIAYLKALSEEATEPNNEDFKIYHYELDLDQITELKELRPNDKIWGKVGLHLNVDPRLNDNMIVCMRAPLMSVSRFSITNSRGQYAGVLIADQEGNYCNQLLRACEPADHASWSSTNADTLGHGESKETAELMLKIIKEWVDEITEELFPKNNSNDIYEGMRDILPIYNPEDPSQRNQSLNKGSAVQDETTKITIMKKTNANTNGTSVTSKTSAPISEGNDDGDLYTGGSGGNGGGNGPGTSYPKDPHTPDDNGPNTRVAKEIPIRFRAFASKNEEKNYWEHIIILSNTKENHESIDLQLRSQGEGIQEPLVVDEASYVDGTKIKVKGTIICGIKIESGKSTRIRVKFKLASRRFSLRPVSTITAAAEG